MNEKLKYLLYFCHRNFFWLLCPHWQSNDANWHLARYTRGEKANLFPLYISIRLLIFSSSAVLPSEKNVINNTDKYRFFFYIVKIASHAVHSFWKEVRQLKIPEIHIIRYLSQKSLIENNLDESSMCRIAFLKPMFVLILHWSMQAFVGFKVTVGIWRPLVFIHGVMLYPTPYFLYIT